MQYKNILSKLFLVLLFFPIISTAHVSQQHFTWQNGLIHPLTGLDHFLTMFGIGVLSYYISDHNLNKNNKIYNFALLKTPILFCVCLLLSFIFQLGSLINLSYITPAVLIIALGLMMVKASFKNLVWLLLPLIAIVHGHIHSTDMLSISLNLPYINSFVLTTFVLHVFGIKLAELFNNFYKSSNKVIGSLFILLGFCLY